jgi:hypothetical protein
MIENNSIELSTSQWSSPIVLVAKKTKDMDGNNIDFLLPIES